MLRAQAASQLQGMVADPVDDGRKVRNDLDEFSHVSSPVFKNVPLSLSIGVGAYDVGSLATTLFSNTIVHRDP